MQWPIFNNFFRYSLR